MSKNSDYINQLELDVEKLALVCAVGVFLFGAVLGSSIGLEGGNIVKAVLSASYVSSNWAGVSGEVTGFQEETNLPIEYFFVDDTRSGTVNAVDMSGQLDGNHFLASVPFYSDSFKPDKLGNVTPTDLEADGLFNRDNFSTFYPDATSYDSLHDNPEKTFTESGKLRVLDEEYDVMKTTLNDGIDYYVLSYETGTGTIPIFLTRIDDYVSCYDGNNCNYQFLLPNINEEYSFYMLSEYEPVNITTLIDGNDSTVFPYSGRPYNLTVVTETVFGEQRPLDTEVRITEREGNNLFMPAFTSNYSSKGQIITKTENGSVSLLMSPTQYNSPEDYNLSVEVYSDGESYETVSMSVRNNNIEFTDNGPVAKGFNNLENSYKKGIDRLRPIANCMYSKVNSDQVYNLEVSSGTDLKVVRGIPYVINANSEFFRLVEDGSHLVMSPARESDTVHLEAGGGLYDSSNEVLFTPTLSSIEDTSLGIELYDSQGDLLGETNLSVRDSTCGSVVDGVKSDAPELNSLKKRVNAIRPVLNSLFVAGS